MPKLGQHQPMATENQEELVNLLKAHPEGLTVNEIAKMVGTSPKIVYQRINYVSLTAPIFDEGHYYFLLDRRSLCADRLSSGHVRRGGIPS